ncbi:MAG: S26 family signal peptidase [Halobacteriovoraceae bacterium]|jgi:hypothetical protein|nr:S26 family signal peptidase [Halobacteriovoraceae bacterium]
MTEKDNTCDQLTFFEYKKVLKAKGKMSFKVLTDSMTPLILPGENIEVVPCDEFKKFDVVIFWDGEKLVSHYIWHKNLLQQRNKNSLYTTRSLISPNLDDLPVSEMHILGLVTDRKISLFQKLKILFLGKTKKSPF